MYFSEKRNASAKQLPIKLSNVVENLFFQNLIYTIVTDGTLTASPFWRYFGESGGGGRAEGPLGTLIKLEKMLKSYW